MSAPLFPRAGFVQFSIRKAEPEANLATLRSLINDMPDTEAGLLVLPELWASGFDYPRCRELATATPRMLDELTCLARASGLWFAGSLIEEGENRPWNTLFLCGPDGVAGRYRKQHLFGYWREDHFFQPGDNPRPMACPFGLVGGLICYDLRFPELARDQVFLGARLLVVSAEWPTTRLAHWRTLLQARAIENQVFVVAANCCGALGDLDFPGHSMVVAPDGRILAEAGSEPEARLVPLDYDDLAAQRTRFCPPAERPLLFRDSDKILGLAALLAQLARIRSQPCRVVFTNGCFDILHAGHADYLEQARRAGDLLVVAMNSDASVRGIKGPSRPVNAEGHRARLLAALGCVDFVVLFDEPIPSRIIEAVRPEVLVKGADWAEADIVGADTVKAGGGVILRIPFSHDLSSTAIIAKCRTDGTGTSNPVR